MQAMDASTMLDFMGVRLIPNRVEGMAFVINVRISDRDQTLALTLSRGCLTHLPDKVDPQAIATLTLTHEAIATIAVGTRTLEQVDVIIEGDRSAVERLFTALDTFDPIHPIQLMIRSTWNIVSCMKRCIDIF